MRITRESNGVERKRDLSILIVDDDKSIAKTVSIILKSSNSDYFIESAHSVGRALELVKQTYWDTILLDLSLPMDDGGTPDSDNGLKAMDILKGDMQITTPIIAITGRAEDEISDIVLDKGAYYFLTKPLKPKSLAAIVKNSTRFQMSGFDGLTGLLNRKTFEERLKSEFERVKRKNNIIDTRSEVAPDEMKSFLSLIFIDCDNFKEINDRFNHFAGDRVLKSIGSSFIDETLYRFHNERKSLGKFIIRPYDIAARYGGDEFAIFLPETDHESAAIVAKRIRDLMGNLDIMRIIDHPASDKGVRSISLSIGIATYPYPNFVELHSDLIRLGDEAMYASKEHREGEIFGYSDEGKIIKLL